MKHVVMLGATSGIARVLAVEFARRGYGLVLAARELEEAQALASDLRLRHGATAHALAFDAHAHQTHARFWEESCKAAGGEVGGAVVCFGYLGDQQLAEKDFGEARRILDTNFTDAVSILEVAAGWFESRRSGFICVLSSVAGDRGRASKSMYGAAKAGLSTYLEGLRQRLFRSGVSVTTVKPGTIDTQMTYGQSDVPLVSRPERIARPIVRAALKGRAVAYVPGFWRWIMLVVRCIPDFIFRRMRI
jgi:short-subunit dehydrogenase